MLAVARTASPTSPTPLPSTITLPPWRSADFLRAAAVGWTTIAVLDDEDVLGRNAGARSAGLPWVTSIRVAVGPGVSSAAAPGWASGGVPPARRGPGRAPGRRSRVDGQVAPSR